MRDPRLTSSEAVKELETAAAALEARIADADEVHDAGDDDPTIHARPLGTGLVSCRACGRVLAAEALAAHRKELCAAVREALGADGVARALGGTWGFAELPSASSLLAAVPRAGGVASVPGGGAAPKVKKMTKKALKEQQMAAAAAAAGAGAGLPGVPLGAGGPARAVHGFDPTRVSGQFNRGAAYDVQHHLFLQQQQQQQRHHQQQGSQQLGLGLGLGSANSAGLAQLAPGDFSGAVPDQGFRGALGVPPVVAAAEKKAAGAKRKRDAAAAAAAAGAGGAGVVGAGAGALPPAAFAAQQPHGTPGGGTAGAFDAATLAQLNAQTARALQQRRAAMAQKIAQQQRLRQRMELDRERAPGLQGVAPLAQVTDVGRLRYLRQRALYSIMFHGTQRELLDRMTPNIVPAQIYLAGASSVVPPFPAVTG